MCTSGQNNLVYADLGPAPMKKKYHVPVHDIQDDHVEYAQLNYHAENHGKQATKNDPHPAGMLSKLDYGCRIYKNNYT